MMMMMTTTMVWVVVAAAMMMAAADDDNYILVLFASKRDTFYSKTGYILNWFMITQYLNSAFLSSKSWK
jgi:hypothetical protein